MRVVLFLLAIVLLSSRGLAAPPCDAPIASREVRQISRVVRTLTARPILFIMAVVEDDPVPGAVTGLAWIEDLTTGTRTPRYTRTDWVDAYTRGSKKTSSMSILFASCTASGSESQQLWTGFRS